MIPGKIIYETSFIKNAIHDEFCLDNFFFAD